MALKPKSIAVLDELIANPKMTQAEAYAKHHKSNNITTARNNASQLIKKPEAQIYLLKHIDKAKKRVVQLVDSVKEDIALKASDSILDRALGKPKQSLDITSRSVSVNLDLTSD